MTHNALTDEYVTIEMLTPERAQQLLDNNDCNRPINAAEAEKLGRDQITNNWHLVPSAIGISRDGKLLNGQHRCTMVVKTGIPARAIFLYNMRNDAMSVTDTGKSRKLAHELYRTGESNPVKLASLLGFMVKHDNDRLTGGHVKTTVTNPEALAYLKDHPEARVYVNLGERLAKRIGSPSILAVAASAWIIARAGGDAEGYFNALINRHQEPDWSAIHAVASRLLTARGQKVPAINLVFLFVNGYNKWALGTPAYKLMLASKTGEVRIPEVIVP